ncbi:MAG: hypothetical protein U9R74_01705 [Pseudomonadota bacterium]|nr:hypothetical protein [Pseudomonadota bacterium]
MMKVLVAGACAAAGGAGGSWVSARIGASYGYRLGPWGVVAGAVVGALAGAALASMIPNDPQAALQAEEEEV